MNEQTLQLIEKIALKLGTTAEHLWGVLVRQAPISGAIGLACDVALILALYAMWKKLLTVDFDNWNWDSDFGKSVMYGGLAIATTILLVYAFGKLPTEIAGFINPEYWALKQISK